MSTAHTPTPWEHTPMADGRHHVLGILCTEYRGNETAPYHPLIASVFHGMGHAPREIAEANAAFIVRACNSHAALVAALERTLAQLDSLANCTLETQTGLIDPRKSPAYAESRAALAAAKE